MRFRVGNGVAGVAGMVACGTLLATAAVAVSVELNGHGAAAVAVSVEPHSHGADASLKGPYVALGDSYTAGPYIPHQTGTPLGCSRSDHNYPSVVAAELQLDPAEFQDMSCGGATIADLTQEQSTDDGTYPAQLSALSADTRLVTLGIGGNDIGFSSLVTQCVKNGLLYYGAAGWLPPQLQPQGDAPAAASTSPAEQTTCSRRSRPPTPACPRPWTRSIDARPTPACTSSDTPTCCRPQAAAAPANSASHLATWPTSRTRKRS